MTEWELDQAKPETTSTHALGISSAQWAARQRARVRRRRQRVRVAARWNVGLLWRVEDAPEVAEPCS